MIKAAFFDIDGILFSHTMHKIPDSARKAVHLLRENGVKVFLATGRGIRTLKKVSWGDLVFDGYITLNGQICLDARENVLFEAPIYQMIGYMTRKETENLAPKIPNCKITRWYEDGIDIISKDGGKDHGIRKILEVHGFTREESIAFGDSDNDLEMLEFAGIGVAMGNAAESVKEVADYVTSHIDEDGIWNACKHFELI